jgi:ElaB/YqjD/DUF883 family membrane-anchored ribosome-binding protein
VKRICKKKNPLLKKKASFAKKSAQKIHKRKIALKKIKASFAKKISAKKNSAKENPPFKKSA